MFNEKKVSPPSYKEAALSNRDDHDQKESLCKKSNGVHESEETVQSDTSEVERGNWSRKSEYILSMIGYAVGLGNVWRFPYLAFENGGGAFLVPYCLMLIIAGLPIFFLESALGQFSSQGPIGAFNGIPIFKGLGFAMVVVSVYVCVYYNVVVTYVLYYLFHSFTTGELPWASCNNTWNTDDCLDINALRNATDEERACLLSNATKRISPSEEYWKREVLAITEGIDDIGSIRWELCCFLLLAWTVMFVCLIKGVKSSGKAVYFTATFPYVVLTILLVRGLSLDGAAKGITFFFKPRWEKLKEAKVWKDAATQIFYSLSASWGGLITLSSYNKFKNNCLRDSVIVVLVNSMSSIFAGCAIFAVIGYMAHMLNVDVAKVAADGPGLAFVVYPEALSQMPAAPVWSVLFFCMLYSLGLSTMFATLETVTTSISDAFPSYLRQRKAQMTLVVCIVCFLLGLPLVTNGGFYYLSLIDNYAASYTLMICAVTEMLALCYAYGLDRFCGDIRMMINQTPNLFWKWCWRLVSPLILSAIFLYSLFDYKGMTLEDFKYPDWANGLGWLMVMSSCMCIPIVAAYEVSKREGSIWQRVLKACKPDQQWGPYLEENRTGIYSEKLIGHERLEVIS